MNKATFAFTSLFWKETPIHGCIFSCGYGERLVGGVERPKHFPSRAVRLQAVSPAHRDNLGGCHITDDAGHRCFLLKALSTLRSSVFLINHWKDNVPRKTLHALSLRGGGTPFAFYQPGGQRRVGSYTKRVKERCPPAQGFAHGD